MKYLFKVSGNQKFFRNSTFFSKKKKTKGKINHIDRFCARNTIIQLSGEECTLMNKISNIKNDFNSNACICRFDGCYNYLNEKNFGKVPIRVILGKNYPLNQNYFNFNVFKIEQLAISNFSIVMIRRTKLFLELKSSKMLIFPLLILTNMTILFNFEKNLELPLSSNLEPFSFSSDNSKKKKNSYQIFLVKKSFYGIRSTIFKLLEIYFRKKNTFIIFGSKQLDILNLKIEKCHKENAFLEDIDVFESRKISKQTLRVMVKIYIKKTYKTCLPKNGLFPKIKLTNSNLKNQFYRNISLEHYKYFENTLDTIFSLNFFNKISCLVIVVSNNIQFVDEILRKFKFIKIDLKIFQIGNISQFSLEELIELVCDLKSSSRYYILTIGSPCQLKFVNLIYIMTFLSKLDCLKILSGLKTFKQENKKIFLLKKSSEKSFIFFPRSLRFFSFNFHSNCIVDGIKLINKFQEKIPYPLYGIDDMICITEFNLNQRKKKIIPFNKMEIKMFKDVSSKYSLNSIFYYANVIEFKEILLSSKILEKKKKKKIAFLKIFFFFNFPYKFNK